MKDTREDKNYLGKLTKSYIQSSIPVESVEEVLYEIVRFGPPLVDEFQTLFLQTVHLVLELVFAGLKLGILKMFYKTLKSRQKTQEMSEFIVLETS